MAKTHRSGALAKMKEHHKEAKRLDALGDAAGTRAAMARAFHARDVVKGIDAGAAAPAPAPAAAPAGTPAGTLPGPRSASSFERTRGGYDPDTMIDYTNSNPSYWSSVKSYFDNHSSNTMGEKGIWIPNLEKEGAGNAALAAQAGGVRAYEGSNYARHLPGERIGGERAMTMESIFRGGEDKTVGYGGERLGRLGKIPTKYHGATMLGGEVTKVPGSEYVKRGGDFGGLLGMGSEIDVGLMDALLGGRDSGGMRVRGTFPSPTGAATTDAAAAGMLGGGMPGGMGGGRGYPGAAASAFKGYGDAIGFNVGPKGGLVYRPWEMDYWKETGIDPALWGGGGMGGGMSPAYDPSGRSLYEYTTPGYAPAPGGRSPGLADDLIRGTPGGAMGAAGAPGTRDGMTAGMHSTHLGAYDRGDGTWVWGPRPMEGGDFGEGAVPAWGEPLGTSWGGHLAASGGGLLGALSRTTAETEALLAEEEAAESAAGGIGGGGFGAPGGAGGGGGFEV